MSDTSSATPRSGSRDYPEVTINPQVLHRSQLLFRSSSARWSSGAPPERRATSRDHP